MSDKMLTSVAELRPHINRKTINQGEQINRDQPQINI